MIEKEVFFGKLRGKFMMKQVRCPKFLSMVRLMKEMNVNKENPVYLQVVEADPLYFKEKLLINTFYYMEKIVFARLV
jgi:hypothetical protein